MTHWTVPFIGIPHVELGRDLAGVDCWGLVHLALPANGLPVPSYAGDYGSLAEHLTIAGLIGEAKESASWRRVDQVKPFDIVTFRQGRFDGHVGIVVSPGKMLHACSGRASRIDDYTTPLWASRFTGAYRHHLST